MEEAKADFAAYERKEVQHKEVQGIVIIIVIVIFVAVAVVVVAAAAVVAVVVIVVVVVVVVAVALQKWPVSHTLYRLGPETCQSKGEEVGEEHTHRRLDTVGAYIEDCRSSG